MSEPTSDAPAAGPANETPPASPATTQLNAAPPPASETVVKGERTERELQLEAKLEAEQAARKKAETDASHHQDEARRLREAQSVPIRRVRSFMGFTQEVEG